MRTWPVLGLVVLCARGLPAQGEGHEHRWGVSLEGTAFLQYVRSFGTRATYQLGGVNRVMVATGGPWAGGIARMHLMASAEPLTLGERGTPQPLQVAFTSDGQTVTDHAHPSRWIMELAASYERPLFEGVTISLYGAAIGAPALGPPVYLHRASAAANPAEPLGHHVQDITHSSFGVVTLGVGGTRVRIEASAFNDRQPDEPSSVFYYRGARLDAYRRAPRSPRVGAGVSPRRTAICPPRAAFITTTRCIASGPPRSTTRSRGSSRSSTVRTTPWAAKGHAARCWRKRSDAGARDTCFSPGPNT